MIIQRIMIALNDKIATWITGGAIGGNATLGIHSFMEKTTPVIIYIGLILSIILTSLMIIYWFKKDFGKKSKNKIDE